VPEFGKSLKQTVHGFVGHLGAAKIKTFEVCESGEVFEARVRDRRVGELEAAQVVQPAQMLQAGVGDLGAVEVQVFEVGQILQVPHPRVADARAHEA
jgi:hypothetical protein